MKVFLTGATGFVGSAVLKRLVSAGHTVIGLAQTPQKAELVKNSGGIPVVGDLLAPDPWSETVKDCDIVISSSSPFDITETLSAEEAGRRAEAHAEMVGNLLHAAAKSRVQAAVLTFHVTAFGSQGDRWVSEVMPISPTGLSRPTSGAYWDIEKSARKAGIPTIEIFPGWVYGPGSWFKHYIVDGLRAGTARVVGAGTNFKSLIHIDDLAEGYRLVLDKMPLGERYCLTDSHPVRQKEFLGFVAREMGLPEPREIDYTVFAKAHGEILAEAFDSSVRVSNNKAKRELGFKPVLDSFCHGVPEALRALGIEPVHKAEMPKAAGF